MRQSVVQFHGLELVHQSTSLSKNALQFRLLLPSNRSEISFGRDESNLENEFLYFSINEIMILLLLKIFFSGYLMIPLAPSPTNGSLGPLKWLPSERVKPAIELRVVVALSRVIFASGVHHFEHAVFHPVILLVAVRFR